MKIFNEKDLVHCEYYFCVHKGMVWYLQAVKQDYGENFFSMCNEDFEQEFDAYECTLIYQL